MSENSSIEWTDHTFNPWIGCTKVSTGCENCYAETQDKFRSWTPEGWGVGKPRKRTSEANWKQPLKWNREAEAKHVRDLHSWPAGKPMAESRPRVFCASLADWLDDEVPIEWLADLLGLIAETPYLDWLLLTKRPENFARRLNSIITEIAAPIEVTEFACKWLGEKGDRVLKAIQPEPPANVWIGTTVEDQARADKRIPALLNIPAKVRFLSCEPLLGPVNLTLKHSVMAGGYNSLKPYRPDGCTEPEQPRIHWVIAGGESGPNARPMDPTWAESLRDQCVAAGVPFLFKQWGEWCDSPYGSGQRDIRFDANTGTYRTGKKAAGRKLDGREWNQFPTERGEA